LRIRCDCLLDMFDKVFFRTRALHGRRHHLSRHHMKIRDQRLRAVSFP
jgi:hypothetical protein